MSASEVTQHVYVMRHGERLDSRNRQWKTTAARPYDTPLTQHGHSEVNRLVKARLGGKVDCFLFNNYVREAIPQ